MEIVFAILAWWPLLLLVVTIWLIGFMVMRNWDTIQLYRHERHQPWYNELADVRRLTDRKFDTQLGGVFTWEDPKKQRTVILEWPPGSKPALIYRWVTENGISEVMRYSEDPDEGRFYIPELYTKEPLPVRARFAMSRTLYELKHRLESYQYRHAR